LYEMDDPAKQAAVQAAGLAIWDVYAACERAGSLDSAIKNAVPNDFASLRKSALAGRHRIGRVVFNGRAAGRFAPQLEALGFSTVVLPSTSPAHAGMRFAEKLAAWREALQPCVRSSQSARQA
ncbi:MAG: DNA-deoxyinosine glycosylase, partial [Rhodocyclaceae bacterium]|nr:DNA-deoxyinosine glycosylase [Rhodocyclaceae bacterium]